MNFIKKFVLEKIKFLEPKDLGKNNALTKFVNTLTLEEQKKEFTSLSKSQQIQYTQAMTQFQIDAMGDIGEATFKALTMFAIKLHKANVEHFTFEQSFYGTKENVKEELFSITFIKVDKDTSPSVAPHIEYAEDNCTIPRKKSETFFEQTDMIVHIIESLSGKFPMNPHNELALRSSCILLVAEFMSQCNMETMEAGLHGLMDGDQNLNSSYKVQCTRKEFILTADNYPPKKKMF